MTNFNNKNLFRFLKLIIKQNKTKLIVAFIVTFVISILDLSMPQITRMIIDDGIEYGNIEILIKLVIIYILVTIFSSIFEILLAYLYSSIKNKATVNLKVKLLNHISKLSGRYYSNIKTGNILSVINTDMYMLENFSAELIFTMLVNIFTAIISLYFLVKIQTDLFLVVCILQIILTILQGKITKVITLKTSEIRNDGGNLSNLIQEYISNIMNIIVSKSRMKFFSSYLNKERNLIHKFLKLDIIISGNFAISGIITGFITISIFGYGGYKIIKGNMTLGELLAFQMYSGMLIGPCVSIVRANTRIGQAKASINRVYSILDEKVDIKVNNLGYRLVKNDCNIIEFKNVYFKYDKDGKYILNDMNLKFEKGKISAIVGGSGCGKSTIVNLIYRFWDINDGLILFDKFKIDEINLKSLRNSINIVTQDVLIFDDTIKNNIILNYKINDNELNEIIHKVGLNDFIDSLNYGLETIVGERGTKISGGQKQRIALARAIISDRDILIFDEATSALDNISQEKILKNISFYLKNKIVIIIAHRLSTIKEADIIYVIENGRVIESGNDDILSSKNGLYKTLISAIN
ncbi:TPA: ABC transporter ATP-binding protein [Clostridioides difficile]|nr:ABC transporter ATP-binding protein [Clostridioides difficile]HBF4061951.1 ABC transporter ATP-binding protein [Clostridioides difficile]HBF6021734.1 ABC transporter ATP-binding protein [Clostridioides difficile]HEK8843453.1 ABC transporter ATP-binding protein [Clostridioides difficile]HEK8922278.1 ABC transporter ATP-binding protein [Clostridioides difficile]